MKKILVVDDDAGIRMMYGGLLKSEGYEVSKAKSAEEATEFLLRGNYDLVLLDINMPEVDGAVMKEVIDECNRGIKVLVASVYPLETQRKLIVEADDYYDKARGTTLLLGKIHTLIGKANVPTRV